MSQLGVSTFVGLGDRADLDAADLLEFFEDDPAAAVIALAIESVGDARRLFGAARRVARRKPVVALSTVGADAETGPLGSTQRLFSQALAQAGVIEVATLAELFDTARLLAGWPAPAGRRVAIVGNAEGTVRLAARAASCRRTGPRRRARPPAQRVRPAEVAAAVATALAASDAALCRVLAADRRPGRERGRRAGARRHGGGQARGGRPPRRKRVRRWRCVTPVPLPRGGAAYPGPGRDLRCPSRRRRRPCGPGARAYRLRAGRGPAVAAGEALAPGAAPSRSTPRWRCWKPVGVHYASALGGRRRRALRLPRTRSAIRSH